MGKVSHTRWFMLALLFAALFIGGRAEAFTGDGTRAAGNTAQGGNAPVVIANTVCSSQDQGPSFGDAVVVTSGEVICHDLTSFGGSVVIGGEINGDVVAFASNVVINGVVHGNVTLYGGNLQVQDGARINGDIHVCGGGPVDEISQAQSNGSVFSCTKSLGVLLTRDSGAEVRFWSIIIWVVLGLVLTALLPEHVMLIRTTVTSKMRRSFVLGVLSILLAPVVLALLVTLIVSIPLAILTAILLLTAWALGTIAIGWWIGDLIMRKVVPQYNTRFSQIIVGMTLLALAGSIPFVGFWVHISTGLLGLGAVLLSRFGTRLYGSPREPLQM